MNIGRSILNELKKEINSNEYDRYIKNMHYDEVNSRSDIAIFTVSNVIIAKWIKTKYTEKIAHLFEVHSDVKPQVNILVGKVKTNSHGKINIKENKPATKSTHLN